MSNKHNRSLVEEEPFIRNLPKVGDNRPKGAGSLSGKRRRASAEHAAALQNFVENEVPRLNRGKLCVKRFDHYFSFCFFFLDPNANETASDSPLDAVNVEDPDSSPELFVEDDFADDIPDLDPNQGTTTFNEFSNWLT